MDHLARHAVACFSTRGDLWQSWENGAAIFEEHFIDVDWSINNLNWQGYHVQHISTNTFVVTVQSHLERRPILMVTTSENGYLSFNISLKSLSMNHGSHPLKFRERQE